jgi:poly-beta-1,6-N-acetyl-D-glucosamine synthase
MMAIDIFGWVATAAVLGYSLFIAFCADKWHSIPFSGTEDSPANQLSVSIVVVARNESSNILSLLNDILLQRYPRPLLEVILVDDQSDDDTVAKATHFASKNQMNLRVIQLATDENEWVSRKKLAIRKAAELSKAEVLLLTDADCSLLPLWVASHAGYYTQNSEAKLVFGAFRFSGKGIFSSLLNLEAMSLTGVAAVTNLVGKPTMCSGANLSYRRELLHELQPFHGNKHIASGDDEFMLHAVQRKYPGAAFYNKEAASLVTTNRPSSLAALYQQRRRWAGKWRGYSTPWPLRLALLVLAGNLGFLVLSGVFLLTLKPIWLLPILLKWYLEWRFGDAVAKNFALAGLGRYFFLMEIIYPIYAVFFGIASNFGKYHWKGRTYP